MCVCVLIELVEASKSVRGTGRKESRHGHMACLDTEEARMKSDKMA